MSDFGKGFIYPLILFAKHCERVNRFMELYKKDKTKRTLNPYSDFFYGATDHLYELEIPEQFKRFKLAKLTQELIDLCFKYRLPTGKDDKEATEKEYDRAFELLDEIAFEVDKKLGLKPKKAQWK